MSIALAAIIVQPLGSREGRILSVIAALMALISFGPQKYFDPQFGLIYPAVLLGQFAALVIFASVVKVVRPEQNMSAEQA
jgi:hypothetical protein